VARGVVTHVGDAVGEGPIPLGTTVLLGREQGADALRTLRLGDPVDLDYHLSASVPVSFRFAIGGYPILRDGRPLADLDTVATAPRTAAGVGQDGHRMYLVVVDGRSERSGGATNAELSLLLARLGADDAVSLDSGGSSTLTVREPGEQTATVRNSPSDGGERSVANGIGVFALP
jgi:exopolysaccharide biosynthesis protein